MPILVQCECGFEKNVPDEWAGKSAKCKCGRKLSIPSADEKPLPKAKIVIEPEPEKEAAPVALPVAKIDRPISPQTEGEARPSVEPQVQPPAVGFPKSKQPSVSSRYKKKKTSPAVIAMIVGIPIALASLVGAMFLLNGSNDKETASKVDEKSKTETSESANLTDTDDEAVGDLSGNSIEARIEDTTDRSPDVTPPKKRTDLDSGKPPTETDQPPVVTSPWESLVDPLGLKYDVAPTKYQIAEWHSVSIPKRPSNFFFFASFEDGKNVWRRQSLTEGDIQTLSISEMGSSKFSDINFDGLHFAKFNSKNDGNDQKQYATLYHIESGEVDYEIPIPASGRAMQFIQNCVVIGLKEDSDDNVMVYNYNTGAERCRLSRPRDSYTEFFPSPGGNYVAIAANSISEEKAIINFWNTLRGRVSGTLTPDDAKGWYLFDAVFSNNGRYFAAILRRTRSPDKSNRVVLWDLQDGTVKADCHEKDMPMNLRVEEDFNLSDDGALLIGHHTAVNLTTNQICWHAPIVPGQNLYWHKVKMLNDNHFVSIYKQKIIGANDSSLDRDDHYFEIVKLPPSNERRLNPILEPIDATHLIGVLDFRCNSKVMLSNLSREQNTALDSAKRDTKALVESFRAGSLTEEEFISEYVSVCEIFLGVLEESQRRDILVQIISNRATRPSIDFMIEELR